MAREAIAGVVRAAGVPTTPRWLCRAAPPYLRREFSLRSNLVK